MKYLACAFALALSVQAAGAQVGHLPTESPFVDLEGGHELTFFGGRFSAGSDPAGVAPPSAAALGVRYDKTVGGPAALMIRFAHVNSERFPVDPTEVGFTAAQRRRVSASISSTRTSR